MKLKKLKLINFLSHENSEIDFDEVGKVSLIIGKHGNNPEKSNGAGKSSLIEGILYAIFERSRISENKSATLNELVRKESNGEMSVELHFELYDHTYRVTRTRDSNKNKGACNFDVLVKDKWRSIKEDKKGNTNKAILDKIGIDYKTFVSSICFQQEEVDHFVKATGSERKEIIKNILQLDKYDDYKRSAKAKVDIIKDELKSVETLLKTYVLPPGELEEKEKQLKEATKKRGLYEIERNSLSKQLEKLRTRQVLFNEQSEKKEQMSFRIFNNKKTIEKIEKAQLDAESKLNEYSKVFEIKKQDFSALQKEFDGIKDKFKTDKSEIMSAGKIASKKLKEVEEDLEKAQEACFSLRGRLKSRKQEVEKVDSHKEGSHCPTCHSKVTEDSKEEAKKALQADVDSISIRLESSEKKLETIKASQRLAASEVEKLKEKVNNYNTWIKEKNHLKARLIDVKEAGSNAKMIVEDQKSIMKENLSLLDQYLKENDKLIEEDKLIKIDSLSFEKLNKEIQEKNKQYSESNSLLSQADLSQGRLEAEITLYKNNLKKVGDLENQRLNLTKEKYYYTQLVELFGKEIPSLIIENSCNELELMTNEILDSISDMSIKLITQQENKKGELRESFEIQVQKPNLKESVFIDNLSSGEKFRVVFAIRIALSKLLVRRRGSEPIEFLFYDECLSSLDSEGIDQVIEVFRYLQKDFRHQLVITHRTELKEMFGDNIILVQCINGVSKIAS